MDDDKSPNLVSADAKVRRATLHANAYMAWQRDFLEPDLYAFSAAIDRGGARHRYKAVDPPPMDHGASLIVGDFLHCLRSALDHVAYNVKWKSGSRRPGRSQFAIENDGLKISGALLPEFVAILNSIQPGGRPELLLVLRDLDVLDRIDKHRFLTVTVAAARILIGSVPFERADLPITPLVDGDVAFTLFYDPPQSAADPDLDITPGVFFGRNAMPNADRLSGWNGSRYLEKRRACIGASTGAIADAVVDACTRNFEAPRIAGAA